MELCCTTPVYFTSSLGFGHRMNKFAVKELYVNLNPIDYLIVEDGNTRQFCNWSVEVFILMVFTVL